MQQDKPYFEKKLKQLENQQLPDMSQLETHWSTMQQMLGSTGAVSVAKTTGKTISFFAAAIVLVSLTLFVYQFNHQRKNIAIKSHSSVQPQERIANTTLQADSTTPNTNDNSKPKKKRHIHILAGNDSSMDKQDANIFSNVLLNVVPCEICPDSANRTVSPADHKALLTDLFQQLAKAKQVFSIDNNRDTLLFAKEGTVLYIPANSFSGKNIKIGLTEYYSYADMIANRLATTSNGQQLVSGGMLHIEASENGVEKKLSDYHKIRAFIPGISSEDSMQLFFSNPTNGRGDTINQTGNGFNWTLSGSPVNRPFLQQMLRAIDLTDRSAIKEVQFFGGKTKAVFWRSRHSVISKKELKEVIQKRYADKYDKIIVRNEWKRPLFDIEKLYTFGDTTYFTPAEIRQYGLQVIDTVYLLSYSSLTTLNNNLFNLYKNDSLQQLFQSRYSIDLNQLGWINCDRFYRRSGPKQDYVVDLKDNLSHYQTFLVFDKLKSIMPGYPKGASKIVFNKIPVDEPFRIISIGINKEGKSVIAMNEGPFNHAVIHEMKFEEADPYTMKTSLSKMNK